MFKLEKTGHLSTSRALTGICLGISALALVLFLTFLLQLEYGERKGLALFGGCFLTLTMMIAFLGFCAGLSEIVHSRKLRPSVLLIVGTLVSTAILVAGFFIQLP